MTKLETHARRLFIKAADERCAALNGFLSAMQSSGRGGREAKDRAALKLQAANALYEAARTELLADIDAAERQP